MISIPRLVLVLGAWLVAGCGDRLGPCDDAPAEVEIGWGEVEFIALADGDTLELVHGPQGGVHTVMGIRLQGLGEHQTVELEGEIDGRRAANVIVRPGEVCSEEGVVALGILLVWAESPEALHGTRAVVSATASGEAGSRAEAHVEVVLDDPAAST